MKYTHRVERCVEQHFQHTSVRLGACVPTATILRDTLACLATAWFRRGRMLRPFICKSEMICARPRWAVSASGLALPDMPGRPSTQTAHFYWPGQHSQTPQIYRRAPGRARHPTPHFYRQGQGQPGSPNPSLLLANLSLLLARPLTSIGQTPHFY